jgi:hypothetical protein
MSETRMLPKQNPRSTGISRTAVGVNRPVSGGTGASNVTASPSAGNAAQQHVKNQQHRQQLPATTRPMTARPGAPLPQRPTTARSAETAAPAPGIAVPTLDPQEHALLAMLLADFLREPKINDDARAIAMSTLDKLAASAGQQMAQRQVAGAPNPSSAPQG